MQLNFCTLIIKHACVALNEWVISQMHTDIRRVQLCQWHTLGKCERDPGLFASHIKVRDATGNELGDRESIQTKGIQNNIHCPLSIATERECRMRLEGKWHTDCPRKTHRQRLVRTDALDGGFVQYYYFNVLKNYTEHVIFLHQGKQDFSCSSQVRVLTVQTLTCTTLPSTVKLQELI